MGLAPCQRREVAFGAARTGWRTSSLIHARSVDGVWTGTGPRTAHRTLRLPASSRRRMGVRVRVAGWRGRVLEVDWDPRPALGAGFEVPLWSRSPQYRWRLNGYMTARAAFPVLTTVL